MAQPQMNIIPRPASVVQSNGVFRITDATEVVSSIGAEKVAEMLAQLLRKSTGYPIQLSSSERPKPQMGRIILRLSEQTAGQGNDGYSLETTPQMVTIRATTPAGLFYGAQSLRQLLPRNIEVTGCEDDWIIPCLRIEDTPRFAWRGIHLDVARHIFPVDFIKRFIDLLAMHKLNVFHWHLTEDQGWRIEIRKHPKLTEISSRREATPIPAQRDKLDGKSYGGFYTQDEVREVVAYAAERFITVVPEIEMPGHTVAVLAAYPELGCTGGPYKTRCFWGVEEDVFCAGNDDVYAFLEGVLDEVFELFPSEVIHIGGDECPKTRWKVCPKCQARIKEAGLKDELELQSYFITRMEKYINDHGRRIIGWDEILEGGLAPNASVMSWRGEEGGIEAARQGHDVVMTPGSHCYFDHYQSEDKDNEPPAIGGFLPLRKVYAYDPVPRDLGKESKHILGVQGNIWTEYMPTTEQVEYMAFPRTSALAEVAWTPKKGKNWLSFRRRVRELMARLDLLNVNFRKLD